MLSKTESEYLKNPEDFPAAYSKALKYRIMKKLNSGLPAVSEDLALLRNAGYLDSMASVTKATVGYNVVTENCNQNIGGNVNWSWG